MKVAISTAVFVIPKKTKNALTNDQILSFIARYSEFIHENYSLNLNSVLFCGGEVFTLKDFPALVNLLQSQHIFISIITNGTINRLPEITDPQNCQLLVSLDGPESVHDQNRGPGNFQKTIAFIKSAQKLGFPVEIMFLITHESYSYKDSFPQIISDLLEAPINLNYITQKTFFYTDCHPLSNQKNSVVALTASQIIDIKKNYPSLPSATFGCFQPSLQSDGQIYGCCESPYPLASINDPILNIISAFKQSLNSCSSCPVTYCGGCCASDFLCGYKKELSLVSCTNVVKLLNR